MRAAVELVSPWTGADQPVSIIESARCRSLPGGVEFVPGPSSLQLVECSPSDATAFDLSVDGDIVEHSLLAAGAHPVGHVPETVSIIILDLELIAGDRWWVT